MKQTRHLLMLVALSCALSACGSPSSPASPPTAETETIQTDKPGEKLSREQAKEIINAHYGFPYVESMRITYTQDGGHLQKGRFGALVIGENSDLFMYSGTFGHLNKEGMTYKVPPQSCNLCIAELPERWANQYYCVASNIWEFKEISGISQDESSPTAIVEYVVKAIGVNTFGRYAGKTEGMEETRRVTLRRFDDGTWKIEGEKPKVIVKPNEVPAYTNKQ